MIRPAKLLCSKEVNGKKVSFFSPPHDGPDYVWVDLEELALAFMPADKSTRLVLISQASVCGNGRSVTTAINGDRIVTVGCHSQAQGLAAAIDHVNGYRGKGMTGPAFTDYCFASAEVEADHGEHTFESAVEASRNIGGPFLRGRAG
jgi:hypothetical protein